MYKIVSFRYESVIQKKFAPQSQIRSYGLVPCLLFDISFKKGLVTMKLIKRAIPDAEISDNRNRK